MYAVASSPSDFDLAFAHDYEAEAQAAEYIAAVELAAQGAGANVGATSASASSSVADDALMLAAGDVLGMEEPAVGAAVDQEGPFAVNELGAPMEVVIPSSQESSSSAVVIRRRTRGKCKMAAEPAGVGGRLKYRDYDIYHETGRQEFLRIVQARRKKLAGKTMRELRTLLAGEWRALTAKQRQNYVIKALQERHLTDHVKAACERVMSSADATGEVSVSGTASQGKAPLAFISEYWCLLTWNNPQWVWRKDDLLPQHHLAGVDACAKLLAEMPMMGDLWASMLQGLQKVVTTCESSAWTASLEICPGSYLQGVVRLHIHAALQRSNAVMKVDSAEDISIMGCMPVKSKSRRSNRGAMGDNLQMYADQAGAAHLYCCAKKIGQVGVANVVVDTQGF